MFEIESNWPVPALLAAGLASLHLAFPAIDREIRRRESIWMGVIGGIAAGYVTLYLLPKIARVSAQITGLDATAVLELTHLRMYLMLLAAIVIYLAMIHLNARETRYARLAQIFDYAVHGAYSLLLGYVFVEVRSDYAEIYLLVAVILGFHLLGMNHLLRSLRTQAYDTVIRWFYFLLLLTGAGLALVTELPKPFINATTAFLAGIILVNVVAEELPLRDQRRMPWFLCGVGGFLLAFYLIITLDPRPAYY